MPVKSLLTPFERVQQRVEIDGKHWMWQGGTTRGGYPTLNVDNVPTTCARIVLAHVLGRPVKKGFAASASCGRIECVSPHCLKEKSRRQISLKHSKGRKFSEAGKEALRKSARERGLCKLSPDEARAIRAAYEAGELQKDIAERYGIAKSTVWRVIAGQTWPDVARNSSVFNWRPAA